MKIRLLAILSLSLGVIFAEESKDLSSIGKSTTQLSAVGKVRYPENDRDLVDSTYTFCYLTFPLSGDEARAGIKSAVITADRDGKVVEILYDTDLKDKTTHGATEQLPFPADLARKLMERESKTWIQVNRDPAWRLYSADGGKLRARLGAGRLIIWNEVRHAQYQKIATAPWLK
jgi:hypothetical protein